MRHADDHGAVPGERSTAKAAQAFLNAAGKRVVATTVSAWHLHAMDSTKQLHHAGTALHHIMSTPGWLLTSRAETTHSQCLQEPLMSRRACRITCAMY